MSIDHMATALRRPDRTPKPHERADASVLIVEDERIIARDLQLLLLDMGYNAYATASCADEALARASERAPDVVLMDIRIGGETDGIQTASLLQKRNPVIVIYLTAHADAEMIERAKRTEPHGYLLKPVKEAELRSMIEIGLYKRDLDLSRARLRATEQRLNTITDNVPISIGYFDFDGRVRFANRVFRELAAYREPAVGVSARTFLGDGLYQDSYRARQRALSGETVTFIASVNHHGVTRQHEVTYLPDRDALGSIIGVYALGYEVTEREQLGKDLRQARVDLESLLNNIPASITSWRADLTNRFANQEAAARFRMTPNEVMGRHARELLGDAAYQDSQTAIDTALGGARYSRNSSDRRNDGTVKHYHDHFVPEILDGRAVGFYTLSSDITEIKESHDRVRELAQRLTRIREEERRAVAIQLHDGIAQDLFALKLGLDHLTKLTKRRRDIRGLCDELTFAVRKCMEDTRQVANELRPVALAYARVGTVICDHSRHFGVRSNLDIRVNESDDFPNLDESSQLLLFRAAQEALTNVARHAEASHAEVNLRTRDGRIQMEISDDGIGISDAALRKPQSLGLLSLRERFESRGGGLRVQRRSPCGTTVIVELPVEMPRGNGHQAG